MVIHASSFLMILQNGQKQLKPFLSGIECDLKRLKHLKHLMERCTVGRNNAKSLWRECGKRSMVRDAAEKLIKLWTWKIFTERHRLLRGNSQLGLVCGFDICLCFLKNLISYPGMLTIWRKISEIPDGIPTENWGVRFEVVLSFRLVRTKWNVAYH